MKNIEVNILNTVKERIKYSKDLDKEAKQAVLDIIESTEVDIMDIIDGAIEHEIFTSLAFEDSEPILEWNVFQTGSKESRLDENFKTLDEGTELDFPGFSGVSEANII